MPRGEPTRTVRLPIWLLDQLSDEAGSIDGVPALITRKCARRQLTETSGALERCTCDKPVLSKHVTNICTACGLLR